MSYLINPDRSIPWNGLPLLPLEKEEFYDIEVLEKLGEAKAALARLHGRSIIIPNQGLLVNTISLQEAKMSSAIENIFTTDDELYKAYSDQRPEEEGASKEVLRYREALWSGYNYLNLHAQFDLQYFIEVFQQIKRTNDIIRPVFTETVIRRGGSGFNAGEVIYTPPRGAGIIEKKMENLIEFVNDDNRFRLDPLLKMAIAHCQFEMIHPFRDGNGRTGRVFNINYLVLKGLLDIPILFLSRYINDHKEDYYHGLMGVSQRGSWKAWILFMLAAVEHTSNITFDKINRIMRSKDNILSYIKDDSQNFKNEEDLVNMIFTQPFTKVKHLVDSKLYAEKTARTYLNRLADMRILEKKEIEGHHYYQNTDLHNILSN